MRLFRDVIVQAMKAVIYACVCPSDFCVRRITGMVCCGFISSAMCLGQ
jgi:hypothetical protein